MRKRFGNILARRAKEETGMAMVGALALLALGGIVIAPMLSSVDTGISLVSANLDNTREYYAADAGVRDGLWQVLKKGLAVTEGSSVNLAGFTANSESVSVQVSRSADTTSGVYTTSSYTITSVAGDSTVEATVALVGTWFTDSGLPIVGGDYVLGPGERSEDSVYVDGDVILGDHAEIESEDSGDLYVYAGGDISMGEDSEIEVEHGGDLYMYAGGSIDIGAVTGDEPEIKVEDGNAYINAELDITLGQEAKIEAKNGDIRIQAGRNMTLENDSRIRTKENGGDICINVGGDLVVEDGARIEAETGFTICICVDGNVTLNSGREIEADFYVGGTLTISSGTTVTGDVYTDNTILGAGTHNGFTYAHQDCPCCQTATVGSDLVTWEIR